jgi:hypothetical protein|uniref:CehA/McbA family metallohydrolase n=1 Tax=Cephaloticoccus sp. TaxID=1985742 RepID=UPI0040499074
MSRLRSLLFGVILGSLCGNDHVLATGETPVFFGITPFQTATFVPDLVVAERLDCLSEFAIGLLVWSETSRESVTRAEKLVSSAYLPYYHEWQAEAPAGASSIDPAEIDARISDGFRQLESPRIVRIDLNPAVVLSAPRPVEISAGDSCSVPVVLSNDLDQPVSVSLRLAQQSKDQAMTVRLAAGQATGFIWTAEVSPTDERLDFVLEVNGHPSALNVPVSRREYGAVTFKVVDETGAATPARVYLNGADQRAHAPSEHMQRIVLADRHQAAPGDVYFHTTGSFAVSLPAGVAQIDAVRGMEYQPVHETFTVRPGEQTEVLLQLRRVADLAAAGWYSGDVHVHANLFAEDRIKPVDVLRIAQAEDLAVTNILPCNDPRTATITDQQYFTGAPDAVSTADHIVYYNEEMRNDLYGHVGFLNLTSFVEPAYFGWPHSPFPYDYPSNYPQVEAAKAQGAFVTYVHPGLPSEFPVDIALGLADTIDVMSQNDERVTTPLWYRLLNCGFRCPASAGTDSFLNIPYHLIPGAGRVYVQVTGGLTYDGWIEGLKAGRTFVTNGPLLPFTFNGRLPGAEFAVETGAYQLTVAGVAGSIVPMEAVEIVVNGAVVRRIESGADRNHIRVNEVLTLTQSSWVAVRAVGSGHRWVTNDREVYAHTSPVYVTIGRQPVASRDDALFFSEQIDILIAAMDARGKFRRPADRDEIVARFREAQAVYHEIARTAFTLATNQAPNP